jgi:hypothetical protein
MENSFWIGGLDASGNWRPPRSVDLTNPRAPCDTLPIRYQRDCYGQQAANFGSATDWNLPEFVEMCRHIPEEFQDQCYVYIGAQQTLMIKDVSAMKEACDIAPIDRYENLCIEALATTLGGRYVGDPSWILSLCALADPNTKETCYRQLAGYLDNWGMNADEYQEVCRKILEQEYAPWCHTGE